MPVVRMPDKTLVRFPDDMPREQIRDMIAKKFPEVVPKKNFVQRVGEDLSERYDRAGEIGNRMYNREQTAPETVFQAGTNAIGAVGDVAIEGAVSAGRTAMDVAKAVAPETTKNATAKIDEIKKQLLQTETGREAVAALSEGGERYAKFAKENPRAAANLKGIGDLLIAPAAIKGAKPIVEGAVDIAKAGVDATAGNVARGTASVYRGYNARNVEDLVKAGQGIKDNSVAAYKDFRDAAEGLRPETTFRIQKNIEKNLLKSGKMNERLHADTISVLKDFGDAAKKANGKIGLEELDQYRQLLSDVVKKNTSKIDGASPDAMKAAQAIDSIDDIVDNLKAKDLLNGKVEAVKALNKGRDEWRRYKKFDVISKIVDHSEGDANYLKRELTKITKDPRRLKGFTAEEVKTLREAANINGGENLLRGLGRFGLDLGTTRAGSGNMFLPIVTQGITTGTGALAGALGTGAGAGATAIAAGTAARQAYKMVARDKVEQLLKQIETTDYLPDTILKETTKSIPNLKKGT